MSAWSTTAASNDGADSTIGTVANTSAPNVVDDWVRGIMASVKKYVLDTDGGITSGGSADVLTITTNRAISSGHQAAGFSVRFKAGNTNTGAATVNVDSIGAVAIKRMNGDALVASDIIAGGIYDIAFDGTNYKLMGANPVTGSFGSLAGDNTWSGVNLFNHAGGLQLGSALTTLTQGVAGVVKANLGTGGFHAATFYVGPTAGTYIQEGVVGQVSVSGVNLIRASGTDANTLLGLATSTGANALLATATSTGADALLDVLGTEVKGALIYHNGTSWVVLAPP